jgi:transaldolase/glucose-6-phosphate isomerase
MSRLKNLSDLGQSIWYDYIRRFFITSGELKTLIEEGLRGVTSNPSIFEKAINGSSDYDETIRRLVVTKKSVEEIYEELVLDDISRAADLLQPVYKSTQGVDGYVSLEVSPTLAHDTKGTIAEARRLFKVLARPNVMIKVPATPAGIPAIEELVASGININVTLIFNLDHYRPVAEAYLKGLERRLADHGDISKVASVASFFISRVDTAVDQVLTSLENKDLQGKIAIANAKMAYDTFRQIFSGSRWEKLAAFGARVQRPLWASTGAKNPEYPDTLYVDQLIGPDTVNTLPPATFNAFREHGSVAQTLTEKIEEAETQLTQLEDLGIDLNSITQKLQEEGLQAFAESFKTLMASIRHKQDLLLAEYKGYTASLGLEQSNVDGALMEIRDQKIITRIWRHDHTVWKPDPAEITNRLGWLHLPEKMAAMLPGIQAVVDELRQEGYNHALLMGMGGSSLAPEVFRFTFGVGEGYLDLAVLDSTDPGAVSSYSEKLDPLKTLYIASTKSGGTVETLSFLKYFFNQTIDAVGAQEAGKHFIAITDPGSELETLAKKLNFRKIFLNDPNIGGRYSALSYFGLVPAALIGVDVSNLLDRAITMACNNNGCNCPVGGDNSGAWLGAIMGELALSGRDKLTLILSPGISHFGSWVEQLIAESTGKEGKGILPVDGEVLLTPDAYANDRLFVYLRLKGNGTYDEKVKDLEDAGHPVVQINLQDLYDLGGEFFRWEIATAIAGYRLGINPFDQPNVESAKVLARQIISTYQKEGKLPELVHAFESEGIAVYTDQKTSTLKEALWRFLSQAQTGGQRGYVALQAYLKPSTKADEALRLLRTKIQTQMKMATTVGYGPRFLHSTGQLHKGDGGQGLFIQFTNDIPFDVPIPLTAGEKGSSITFGTLKLAQALGDREALLNAGRKVIRFHFGTDANKGLLRLIEEINH